MQSEAMEIGELANETSSIQNLYGIHDKNKDKATFARMCLTSRRLVEKGVRFVQLYNAVDKLGWDGHGNNHEFHQRNSAQTDGPIAALLTDLKQRGLLDSTLVVWAGEFGRTPMMQGGNGRNHNPYGFTIWMAGGGYKMEGGKLVSKVSLPQGTITCAIQDSSGDVWLGTDGSGVFRYDGTSMRHYADDHGFSSLRVTCMHEDEKGNIWMGTEMLGANKIQGLSYFEAGAFHHLQESADCPVKAVNTIASDKRGTVWFAGNDGALYRYNGRSFSTVDASEFLVKR
jgi:ligand-binding sensor domain-containing protein